MTSARWTVGVALLLGCLPVAVLQACGGSGGTGTGSHGDGGAGDDGTVGDGSGGDGAGGGDSGDAGRGDGSFNDGGPCVPGCPANVTCGRYTDCTGHVLSCGMPCPAGKACITSGSSQSCQPPSCKIGDAASKCGEIAVDSCGVPVNCGGCPAGETCVNNACVTQPPPADAGGGGCGMLSCAPAAGVNLCGTVSDGCGNTKQCTCPMGQDCTGGVCTAPPPECTGDDGGTGSRCGTISNACGSGQVKCPGCTGDNQCDNGTCTGCTPKTCAEAADAGLVTGCGTVDLGCGVSKDCAPCATGEVCRASACCTPQTCAEAVDAGIVTGCSPVDLGCGVQQSCMACVAGQLCQNDTCVTCLPKTCADFSGGCGHSDGCGHTLDCCASGTTCMSGNVCCQAGEVVYQGSCCLPQCNPNLPAGPQDSCGTVIYCSGGGGSQ